MDRKRFVENLQRDYENMDVLLDGIPENHYGNPVRANIQKMASTILKVAQETDTLATDFASVDAQIFPILRRTFWPEIAFDLVTVQPMTMPTGKIFWVDDLYATAEIGGSPDAITADSRMDAYLSHTYADIAENNTSVKNVGQTLASVTIDTAEKKLRAVWSPEAMQDAKAYLGLDLESEHVRIISQEFRREIGYFIIHELFAGATAGNVNWSITPPVSSDTVNTVAHANRIWESIIDANRLIFQKKYVNANFILASPTQIARMEKANNEFKITKASGMAPNMYQWGRQLVGTVESLWGNQVNIYKDPWCPESSKILVGYKGSNWFEAGAFWAPYVALWMTPTFADPDDAFKLKKGGMTRFGKRSDRAIGAGRIILDGDYYATVTITTS